MPLASSNSTKTVVNDDRLGEHIMCILLSGMRNWLMALKDCDSPKTYTMAKFPPSVGPAALTESGVEYFCVSMVHVMAL